MSRLIILYADDIMLLTQSVSELQLLLTACEQELLGLDMSINSNKSCCMRIGPRFNVNCINITTSSGFDLPWVPDDPLRVSSDLVRSVRNLGIHLDSNLSMNTRITRTVSGRFAVLRQIRSISRSVSQPVVQSLIVSLLTGHFTAGLW